VCGADTNQEFVKWAQKKIMDRLTILAAFCPKTKEKNSDNLKTRGEHIFSTDEKDKKSAALFLVTLLQCIERWVSVYNVDVSTGK